MYFYLSFFKYIYIYFFMLSTGSGRQQPILLAESVLLHQPAENPEQADQVEALSHHGEQLALGRSEVDE